LAALGSSLVQYGINVNSAQQENDDGQVFSVFKVTTKEGKQVPKVCVTLLCSSVTWGGIVTRRGGGLQAVRTCTDNLRVIMPEGWVRGSHTVGSTDAGVVWNGNPAVLQCAPQKGARYVN
jgi:hypothetical protein